MERLASHTKRTAHLPAIAFLTLLAVLTLSMASISPVRASTPTTGSGTIAITSLTILSVEQVDGYTVISATHTSAYTGILSGTASFRDLLVIHPDGTATAVGVGTFAGSAAGSNPGTAYIVYQSTNNAGTFRIGLGTGNLAEVAVKGTFAPSGAFTYTYQATVVFDD